MENTKRAGSAGSGARRNRRAARRLPVSGGKNSGGTGSAHGRTGDGERPQQNHGTAQEIRGTV
jgi:hypothetical protein